MYIKYTFAVVDSTILFIALKVIVFYESINCKLMACLVFVSTFVPVRWHTITLYAPIKIVMNCKTSQDLNKSCKNRLCGQ